MPRLDRLATLYCFYPLKKIKSSDTELRIPILMYHSISEDNENGLHPYYKTTTSPAVFNEQMKYLYDNNYSVISLSEAVSLLKTAPRNPKPETRKFVVITFDDGFRDFYSKAFPILEEYKFTATIFLATDFINKRSKFKDKECLSWKEARELDAKGIHFGSHTVTHPKLKSLNKEQIEYELQKSKTDIEDKLGKGIESFSYPYKFPEEDKKFTLSLKDVLESSGYKNGVSTRLGTAAKEESFFFLKRLPVNSCDDFPFFKAKLEGGYDWLYVPQHIFKKLKEKH